jgi:hypothetical protein
MFLRNALLYAFVCGGMCSAQVANLSGTWKLNAEKSSWGRKQKPAGITIHIQHAEPALAYSGMVVDTYGDGRAFEFKGALDGKPQAITNQYGSGTIVFRRLDLNTTTSLFKSADGTIVEETKTRLLSRGRVLSHAVRLKDPTGELSWTEVYEKQ